MSSVLFGKELDEILEDIGRLDIPLEGKAELKRMVSTRPRTGEELKLNDAAARSILFDRALASKVEAHEARLSTILRLSEKIAEDDSFILSLSEEERARFMLYREIKYEMERAFFEEMTEEEYVEWVKKGFLPFWRASLSTERVLDMEGRNRPIKLFLRTRSGKIIERVSGPDNTVTVYTKDWGERRDKRLLGWRPLEGG